MLEDFIDQFLPSTVGGLAIGAIYALVALGYTMVYGVLRLINFAHSEIFMIGTLRLAAGGDHRARRQRPAGRHRAGRRAAADDGRGGAVVRRRGGRCWKSIAYRPLRKRGASRLAALISAIGASLFLQELFALFVIPLGLRQPRPRSTPRCRASSTGTSLFTDRQRRRPHRPRDHRGRRGDHDGRAGPAGEPHPDRPRHPGHRAGPGGRRADGRQHRHHRAADVPARRGDGRRRRACCTRWSSRTSDYNIGFILGIKAFTAAVLGGIGNIRGALLGGIALGLIENWGAIFFGSAVEGRDRLRHAGADADVPADRHPRRVPAEGARMTGRRVTTTTDVVDTRQPAARLRPARSDRLRETGGHDAPGWQRWSVYGSS